MASQLLFGAQCLGTDAPKTSLQRHCTNPFMAYWRIPIWPCSLSWPSLRSQLMTPSYLHVLETESTYVPWCIRLKSLQSASVRLSSTRNASSWHPKLRCLVERALHQCLFARTLYWCVRWKQKREVHKSPCLKLESGVDSFGNRKSSEHPPVTDGSRLQA